MRILEQPYLTADGTLDFPFAYVYDASALTDGSNVLNIAQQLQGDSDFILRRIMGVTLCVDTAANGGRWNFKNARGNYAIGNPTTGIAAAPTWSVVPEKLYRVNDQIGFDLYKVLRTATVCAEGTFFTKSQILFSGVKRFGHGSTYPRQLTPYKYREVPYTYSYDLTIDWPHLTAAGLVSPSRRFVQQMENFDFELLSIEITKAGQTGGLATNDFQIMLYDANQHQFFTQPVNQHFLNSARPTAATAPRYQPCFPTPSQIYPRGGAIIFDVTSMLCSASLPITYNIAFQGIWRYPCK